MARAAALALILVTAAAIYAPVLEAPFVYEDSAAVSPVAPSLRSEGTGRFLPSRQLTVWSYTVTSALVWLEPRWFHAGNLAVHLVNGVLVYLLAAALVGPWVGMASAAAFLWLPLNSEAVAYVSGRSDLLMTMGALIACLAVLRDGWSRWLMVGLGLCIAGMSKEVGLLAIPLVGLTFWLRSEMRPESSVVGLMLLVAGAMYLSPLLSVWQTAPEDGWVVFLGMQHTAVWHLLTPSTWFGGLSIDHDFRMLGPQWDALAVVGSGLALWAAWECRAMAWGVTWVAVVVAPRFLFPTPEVLHEQHLYLATVPICLGLGWLAVRLLEAPVMTPISEAA